MRHWIFSPKFGNMYVHIYHFYSYSTSYWTFYTVQENKKNKIGKDEIKLFLFADVMIVYVKFFQKEKQNSSWKLLELMSWASSQDTIQRTKVNLYTYVAARSPLPGLNLCVIFQALTLAVTKAQPSGYHREVPFSHQICGSPCAMSKRSCFKDSGSYTPMHI